MNELGTHYNLDECIDRKLVIDKLKFLVKEGKIMYSLNGEILKIDDIDLEDKDIDELLKLFSDNDIFEDYECDDYDEWDELEDDFDEEW